MRIHNYPALDRLPNLTSTRPLPAMADNDFPQLFGSFPNYYELLGVSASASTRDINLAYRRAALKVHPDKAGSTPAQNEKFAAISNAKDVLIDPCKKSRYDLELRRHLSACAPQIPVPHAAAPQTKTPASSPSGSFHHAYTKPKPYWIPDDPFFTSKSHGHEPPKFQPSSPSAAGNPTNSPGPERSDSTRTTVPDPFRTSPRKFSPWDRGTPTTFGQTIFGQGPAFPHAPQCNHDPQRCPVHTARDYTEPLRWVKPHHEGDPRYIDPSRARPFRGFSPPASAYGRGEHNGTKPEASSFRAGRWRCFSLAEEHQKAIEAAFQLCEIAGDVERIGQSLHVRCVEICGGTASEEDLRVLASLDLIAETVYFVEGGYRYYARTIDNSAYWAPDLAIPKLLEIHEHLEPVQRCMEWTNAYLLWMLDALPSVYNPSKLPPSASELAGPVLILMTAWERLLMLPKNITQGVQDVFFAQPRRFENIFNRKLPSKRRNRYLERAFIFKDVDQTMLPKNSDPATKEIWDKWQVAQRTREALQEQESKTEGKRHTQSKGREKQNEKRSQTRDDWLDDDDVL
jgi:curved DNA-binding protein CbpA